MAIYTPRAKQVDGILIANERKYGNTLKYWYNLHAGTTKSGRDKWLVFDIREVARVSGTKIPDLISLEELTAQNIDFEALLHRDIQRVAEYIATLGDLETVKSIVKKSIDTTAEVCA